MSEIMTGHKGHKFTDEEKIIMSNKCKGRIPHNKGKTNEELYGEKKAKEIKRKQRNAMIGKYTGKDSSTYGRKHTEAECKKMSDSHLVCNQKEENHPQWKGDKVGYGALHEWVSRHKGKPTKCEKCGKDGLTGHKIQWANVDHEYKRDLDDWIRLCPKCHSKYDRENGLI